MLASPPQSLSVLAQLLGVSVVESGSEHGDANWILGETKEWGQRQGAAKGRSRLAEEKSSSAVDEERAKVFGEAT